MPVHKINGKINWIPQYCKWKWYENSNENAFCQKPNADIISEKMKNGNPYHANDEWTDFIYLHILLNNLTPASFIPHQTGGAQPTLIGKVHCPHCVYRLWWTLKISASWNPNSTFAEFILIQFNSNLKTSMRDGIISSKCKLFIQYSIAIFHLIDNLINNNHAWSTLICSTPCSGIWINLTEYFWKKYSSTFNSIKNCHQFPSVAK